jgi:spoIIIJ-associated protein
MDEHQVEEGKKWLEELLRLSGLPTSVSAEVHQAEAESSCWLTIDPNQTLSPEQVQLLTEGGAALDALQYLANTTLNMGRENALAYTIELDGYRVRREAELKEMADKAAAKVRETQSEYEMGALSSAERRQVHTYLKSFDDLDTYSRGKEPDRRLVVRLASDSSEPIE